MAAGAELKTDINTEQNILLDENKDNMVIPINYMGNIINTDGYANKKHVKEIKLKLYINGQEVSSISGSKTMNVGSKYMFKVNRDKFSPNITHSLKIKVEGYVHTEFNVDGLIQDTISKEIKIKVEPKKIIPINSENVQILSKRFEKMVVSPLAQTINTRLANSVGFVEAGKYLIIKYDLNISKDKIKNLKIFIDNKDVEKSNICQNIFDANKNKNTYALAVKIPIDIPTTLFGIYSLREHTNSYFNFQRINVLDRKSVPHVLKIKFDYENKEYTNEIKFDTFDNYLTNINYTLENRIINKGEINKYQELKKWLENI